MKLHLSIIFMAVFLMTACTPQTDYHKSLVRADSAMQSQPDSALYLLQNIPTKQLKTKADVAYYALLRTQAQDKNCILQTNDSLITLAIHYYDSVGDAKMQAKAYYYYASVLRDQNKQAEAVKLFLKALPFAKDTEDYKLMGRIYNNVGFMYSLQRLYEEAGSIYQQVEKIGILLKDTSLWAESLSQQGNIRFYQGDYAQAEEKQLQALHVLGNYKQDGIRANVAQALSTLYCKLGNGTKAIHYAKQSIAFQSDTSRCYRAFLLLGDAYCQTGHYDSATVYLKKSLASTGYGTKASAYMHLADIAEAQGDTAKFIMMKELSALYIDSLNQSSQSNDILKVGQQAKIQQLKKEHYDFLTKYHYYIIATTAACLLLVFFIRRRYLKKLHQQQCEQIQKEKQISMLKEKLDILNERQRILIKGNLKNSIAYAKMQKILSDVKEKGHSKEILSEEEWKIFLAEVDKGGVISNLSSTYHLKEKETNYCCLLLTDFTNTEKQHILKVTHATIYRAEEKILKKMGVPYEAGTLKKILKDAYNDVSIEKETSPMPK